MKWALYDPWGDFCGYAYSLEEAEAWESKGEGWDTDPVGPPGARYDKRDSNSCLNTQL